MGKHTNPVIIDKMHVFGTYDKVQPIIDYSFPLRNLYSWEFNTKVHRVFPQIH